MNKEYNYNGKQYKLKPVTLGVLRDTLPLILKLRKLVYQYTNDIDMTTVNKARTLISELEKAKSQLTARLDEDLSNEERMQVIGRINRLAEKIRLHKTELETDKDLSGKIKLYNECSSLAVIELMSDIQLIQSALENLLECYGNDTPVIDTDNPEALKFITNVITDFFLRAGFSKSK